MFCDVFMMFFIKNKVQFVKFTNYTDFLYIIFAMYFKIF